MPVAENSLEFCGASVENCGAVARKGQRRILIRRTTTRRTQCALGVMVLCRSSVICIGENVSRVANRRAKSLLRQCRISGVHVGIVWDILYGQDFYIMLPDYSLWVILTSSSAVRELRGWGE